HSHVTITKTVVSHLSRDFGHNPSFDILVMQAFDDDQRPFVIDTTSFIKQAQEHFHLYYRQGSYSNEHLTLHFSLARILPTQRQKATRIRTGFSFDVRAARGLGKYLPAQCFRPGINDVVVGSRLEIGLRFKEDGVGTVVLEVDSRRGDPGGSDQNLHAIANPLESLHRPLPVLLLVYGPDTDDIEAHVQEEKLHHPLGHGPPTKYQKLLALHGKDVVRESRQGLQADRVAGDIAGHTASFPGSRQP
ncbi:MAG: hypothetical protein Q9224_007032, partial [Gallowayella concinna]